MIHLDTSFLIRALVAGSPEDSRLRSWVAAGESLRISAIGWAEFLCGPIESGHIALAARIIPECVPFTEEQATLAARLFNDSGRRRGTLTDCMIAAAALRSGASLATSDRADFRRFEKAGLRLEDTR